LYCEEEKLIEKCSLCGCPTQQACDLTTDKCYVFSDNFESRDFSLWSGNTTSGSNIVKIATEERYDGNYSAYFYSSGGSNTSAYIYKNIPQQDYQINLRFYIKIKQIGEKVHFGSISGSIANRIRIGVSNRKLYLLWIDGCYPYYNYFTGMSATTLEPNKWYCIELQAERGINKTIKVFLDGSEVLDLRKESSFCESFKKVFVGASIGSEYSAGTSISEVYIDKVKVADSYIGC
jgi:hypothetical protein